MLLQSHNGRTKQQATAAESSDRIAACEIESSQLHHRFQNMSTADVITLLRSLKTQKQRSRPVLSLPPPSLLPSTFGPPRIEAVESCNHNHCSSSTLDDSNSTQIRLPVPSTVDLASAKVKNATKGIIKKRNLPSIAKACSRNSAVKHRIGGSLPGRPIGPPPRLPKLGAGQTLKRRSATRPPQSQLLVHSRLSIPPSNGIGKATIIEP